MSELNEVVFQHETPVQLRFNDMDMLGHANNAIVQEYFDVGRVHYLKDTFTYKLWQGENTVILANINTDFIVPVFIQDDIVVKTTTLSIGTKSFKMVQHLFDRKSNQIKAICKSVMVAVNKESGASIEICQEWRELLSKTEKREL